jgi:DNA-binding transcriptional regulator LsrR (DeoR family)
MEKYERRLDLAARAGWLYYIAGNTQDEIAQKLNVSRQAAQRLVSVAVSEKLVKFRLDHPLAECEALAEGLRQCYSLTYAEVWPDSTDGAAPQETLGVCAAACVENYLLSKAPAVFAFGTGRTLRAMASQIAMTNQPQHKLVSLIGNMSHDGRASHFEVVMRLAERIGASAYLTPTPVIASSVAERDLLQRQEAYLAVRDLAMHAKVAFLGISEVGWGCPLHVDQFVSDAEIAELIERNAVGEILGWAFDREGRLIRGATNDRVAGLPLQQPVRRLTIGIAGGPKKAEAIRGALLGKLVTGLITNEGTARTLLDLA